MPDAPPSDDAFKRRDASSYEDVLESFDRFTRRFTEPLARRAVELGAVGPGDRVLDVGTGTGVVAIEAATRVGPAGRVTGIDLSPGMLREAGLLATKAGLAERATFVVADAERLPFEDASFDVVTSLFALLHFPRPEAALREMHRVLRPGGRVVVGIGAPPSRRSLGGVRYLLGRLPLAFQRRRGRWLVAPEFLVDLVERLLPPSGAPEETAHAKERRHTGASLCGMLARAGFDDVRGSWRAGVGRIETVEEFWDLQRTFSSVARKRIGAAAPDDVARLKREFFDRCDATLRSGGRLTYPYTATYAAGRRR